VSGFSAADIPDLTGQTVIVTGANSGLGLATAQALGDRGARVVLAVRDQARGQAAAATVAGPAEVRPLDLARLESVGAFARDWDGPVDLLVNNAGVMIPPLSRTADGFELQFGTNHLGHFALTNLLLPSLTPMARVVTVSSGVHHAGRLDFSDLNWERRRYRRWRAYGQSKLANLLFTSELQRRLTEAGSAVRSMAAHPGYVATNLQSHSGSRLTEFTMVTVGNRLFAQDAAAGALPTLYAAYGDLPGDTYAGPSGLLQHGPPAPCARSAAARDAASASRLWTVSEELTGVTFAPDPAAA
jgi:NAD(P)-dependent dehydrogenase (short-subunit alcohol dehydrogenase family)